MLPTGGRGAALAGIRRGDTVAVSVSGCGPVGREAGTVAIVGVHPPSLDRYPIGEATRKNLTIEMGDCHRRAILPRLVQLVASGVVDPTRALSHAGPLVDAIEA